MSQISSLEPNKNSEIFGNFDDLNMQKSMQFEDGFTIKEEILSPDTTETQCQLHLSYKTKVGFKIEILDFPKRKKRIFKTESKRGIFSELFQYSHTLGFDNDKQGHSTDNQGSIYHWISQDGQLKEENANFRKEIVKILKKIIPLLSKSDGHCQLPLIKEYINWAYQSYFEGFTYNQYVSKLKKNILKKSENKIENFANIKSSFIKRTLFFTGIQDVMFNKVKATLGHDTLRKLKKTIKVIFF